MYIKVKKASSHLAAFDLLFCYHAQEKVVWKSNSTTAKLNPFL